ncbi:WhiB family transcriptional regulator [Kineococcus radiotolerans]|uniref:Transcriptional regulator WhiB n=1 Tax=Kineococcus radiotolerans (strain ATCC BAA-149 / DSM 14245 / SRS30216) TaxID=266940 RepID=A6W8W3_KINRD|nr:WhiB family transcriptional regulator [Kineococcus radiotolerans]ABS03252.1 transcription factor WhiB [Kineococcus radiotolerans SRS30216 = ATCC BAA-149]
MSLINDTAWMQDALCAQVDTDVFFPEQGESSRPAKAICARCEVRDQCLQLALDNGERHGVWGGIAERPRRDMSRDLRRAA